MLSRSPDSSRRYYRFAGVELDCWQHSVRVDGQACACSRKAFEFLVALCRADDRVVSRNELIAGLWPGGQVVSDEALTQVIFRARAVLGPYAPLIVTLRGVGLRLDAPVAAADATESRPEGAIPAPAVPAEESADERFGKEACAEAGPEVEPCQVPSVAAPREPGAQGRVAREGNPAVSGSGDVSRHAGAATPAASARRGDGRLPIAALVLALALVAVVGFVRYRPGAETTMNPVGAEWVDEGYGLMAGDLKASSPETEAMIREALQNEAHGERSRSMDLLRAVHAVDRTTPIPALFLAFWSGGQGDMEPAAQWLDEARVRVDGQGGLYLPLMLAYIDAEIAGTPEKIVSTAGAVLDLRPDAWRMRHARGHLLEYMGMRAAALHELQQITVPALGNNKRDMALADRASLGDLDGARAVLAALPADVESLSHAYISGRLAWTAGDFEAALGHFLVASTQSYDRGRIDIHGRALKCAAMLQVLFGRDEEAIELASRARSVLGGRSRIDDVDLSLLLAQLYDEAGRTAEADEALERANARLPDSNLALMGMVARFDTLRMRPQWPQQRPADLEPDAAALWLAMRAFADGDTGTARTQLSAARQAGIGLDRLADEARWLELQLGLTVAEASVIDPPLPPISRVVLRRAIRRALSEQGKDSGGFRP